MKMVLIIGWTIDSFVSRFPKINGSTTVKTRTVWQLQTRNCEFKKKPPQGRLQVFSVRLITSSYQTSHSES